MLRRRYRTTWVRQRWGVSLGLPMAQPFPRPWKKLLRDWRYPGIFRHLLRQMPGRISFDLKSGLTAPRSVMRRSKAELRASIEAAEAERALLIAVEELRDAAFNAADLSCSC